MQDSLVWEFPKMQKKIIKFTELDTGSVWIDGVTLAQFVFIQHDLAMCF